MNVKEINIDKRMIPPIIAGILILVGVVGFHGNIGIMGNFILLGIVIGIFPAIFITYFEFQKIRVIEEQLPIFLLDLAEAQKTGMTLPEALRNVSKTDYGKLTPEIKKVNDQISWGVPIQDVFNLFSKRMKRSKMIMRIVRIIIEAYNSGGDIARTMETTATDILALRETEKERKTMVAQHVMVIYTIYFIFLGIIIGLSKTLLPMLEIDTGSGGIGNLFTFQDPCGVCTPGIILCISCTVFGVITQMFNLGTGATAYYNSLFLSMVVIQGIFSGLVAGQIGEGSAIAGIKHSVIMTAVGFSAIIILLQTGLI